MFTDPQKKKKEFRKRIQLASSLYSRIIYDYQLNRRMDNFIDSSQDKLNEVERSLKSITRWNITDIERDVEDYEEYCQEAVATFKWFFGRYGDTKFERLNQILMTHVTEYVKRLSEDTRRKHIIEIHRIAGRFYFRMLECFEVAEAKPMYFQGVVCPNLETEAKREAENYLKSVFEAIENEKRRKEEHAYNTAVAQKKVETDAQIDILKKNYDAQVLSLQENFEGQLEQVRLEFQNKLSDEVEKKYQADKPAQIEEWEIEFISRQGQIIEEEVNKRLKKQFNETLNRKDEINQETINLNTLKYEQAIKKLEAEYQEHIKKIENTYEQVIKGLEDKISFLDARLKETIVGYEKLFEEKYEAEIEKRARILAKEYLQKDFPFE